MGYSSQAGQLLVRRQTAEGVVATDMATAAIGILLRSGSLSSNRELMVLDDEIGGGRDKKGAYLGAASWSGDYEFYARPDAFLTLLSGALGTNAAPVTATGVTTHTVTPSDLGQLPFFTIEEGIGAALETYKYQDAVVNTFHLEVDANGYLMGTAGIIAKRQTAGVTRTDGSALYDNGPVFVGSNTSVTFGGVTLPAKSFSLDINNNFADDNYMLGSFYLNDLTPQGREITSSFNIRHANSALWRQATYGAAAATTPQGTTVASSLVIHTESYEKIGATVTPFSIDITIPNFLLEPFSYEASGSDVLENDIAGRAIRPTSSAIMSVAVKTGKTTIS